MRMSTGRSGVMVTATERRSQRAANREAAYERMAAKLRELQYEPPPRTATRPMLASKVRRVEGKRRVSAVKRLRSSPPPTDD